MSVRTAALLSLAAISLARLSFADEPAFFSTRGIFQSTTDSIIDRALFVDYRSHRRGDLDWPHDGEALSAWDFGLSLETHTGSDIAENYSGFKAVGLVGRKFSPAFYAELSAGPHLLHTVDSKTTPVFSGSVSWDPESVKDLGFKLSASRDYIYPDLIQPGGVTGDIVSQTGIATVKYKPLERIRTAVSGSIRDFTDGNSRRYGEVAALYGISTGVPWIWVGVGADYLSYALANSGYWSPQNFYSFGTRMEADIPIWSELSFSGGFNLNHIRQDAFTPGLGYYLSAALRYGTRAGPRVEAGYIRIQSAQESNQWNDDAFTVAFNTSF